MIFYFGSTPIALRKDRQLRINLEKNCYSEEGFKIFIGNQKRLSYST